jgi:hypothetical protein
MRGADPPAIGVSAGLRVGSTSRPGVLVGPTRSGVGLPVATAVQVGNGTTVRTKATSVRVGDGGAVGAAVALGFGIDTADGPAVAVGWTTTAGAGAGVALIAGVAVGAGD